jgi:hypothetical protein
LVEGVRHRLLTLPEMAWGSEVDDRKNLRKSRADQWTTLWTTALA